MPRSKSYDATTIDLLEQWDFLKLSMEAYDEGREHEAKRLAVTIRVLVHDHGGTSLLTQLGKRDEMQWLTAGAVDPYNLLPSQQLTVMRMEVTDDGGKMSYQPLKEADLLAMPHGWTDFDTYWNEAVIQDGRGIPYSRRNLVLMLANRAGGAHVGKLEAAERSLASGTEFGWAFVVGDSVSPFHDNPVPASVRSMASEIDLTLRHNAELLGVEESDLARPNDASDLA
ncbi:hypothetical protein [Curtobacterium flaccumfaciens]|uniref:hypothetical protein n=1 Tax=Curtobacterium flaccumfaciens TaxID=2035 RepID=UPI001BDEEA09|nr:hypothetical protein [Curtobacterium flaccumfaciens]MBT1630469.1 hypothetical protein [Curtobacterium flaccumfaciens pv. oortii]MCX2843948.1 hypothetical protein [Curtobacterium flaccumfaciens pv. oortii]